MKLDAEDIIEAAALIPCGTASTSRPGIIARLGEERRAVLRALKSDDLRSFGPLQKRLVSYGLDHEPRWGRRSKRWS